MVDTMDLSLDELIRINNKNNAAAKKNFEKSPPKQQGVLKGGAQSGISRSKYKKPEAKNKQKMELIKRVPNAAANVREPRQITIANVDYLVKDAEIKQLFSEFGPVKKAVVHYDFYGRSIGTADITFMNRNDAFKAIKQLNGVPLDGRPMRMRIAEPEYPLGVVQAQKKPFNKNRNDRKQKKPKQNQNSPRQPQREGKKGSQAKETKRQPKPKITAKNLDAELDAYMMGSD